jgi:hypothetical protein
VVNLAEIESAFGPVSGALEADGYRLEVSAPETDRLRVEIIAGPEACEDCLVPKSMLEKMLEAALGGAGLPNLPLDVVYPVEGRGAAAH